MGIVIRQSSLTTFFSYLGVIIGYFNILWLFPKVLELDQIGLVRFIQDAAFILLPFAQIGLSQSVIKFFPQFKGEDTSRRSFITFCLFIGICFYALFVVVFHLFEPFILSLFGSREEVIGEYVYLILSLTFILSITAVLEGYSRSLLKIIVPNFLRDVWVRLLTGIITLCYFIEIISFLELLYLLVLNYLSALLILIIYLVRQDKYSLSFKFSYVSRRIFRAILDFGIFSFTGAAGSQIIARMDILMITAMLGLDETGIYAVVFYMGAIIEMPKRAVSQVTTPLVSDFFTQNKIDKIKLIYQKTAINQQVIGMMLLIGLLANLDNIIYLIPNWQKFEGGINVIYFIGLAKLIGMSFGINSEIIWMSKYYRFNILLTTILAVLTVVTNYILIPLMGISGAALATLITISLFNILKLVFIKKQLKMQPFTLKNFWVLCFGAIILWTSLQISSLENIYLDILVRSIAITIVYTALILITKVSAEIDGLFDQIKRKIL